MKIIKYCPTCGSERVAPCGHLPVVSHYRGTHQIDLKVFGCFDCGDGFYVYINDKKVVKNYAKRKNKINN